jgi:hypothetical protein
VIVNRLRVVLAAGLGAVLVGAGVQAATGTSSGPGGTGARAVAAARGPISPEVNFVSVCGFSHRNQDDPIVYPKQPGRSHDHTFFGNTTTDASSTLASMRAGTTTCKRAGDTAGYWVPTLFRSNGDAVQPLSATVYYRRRTRQPVLAFPPGLKMIAGNSHASDAQSTRIVSWGCGAQSGVPPSTDILTCPGGRQLGLRLRIRFPSCWNGTQLDSADHMEHMAYPAGGRCPSSHPFAVPQITLIVNYGITGGEGLELSSGGEHTGHADFFNAWKQGQLRRLVGGCLNQLRHCGRGGPSGAQASVM